MKYISGFEEINNTCSIQCRFVSKLYFQFDTPFFSVNERKQSGQITNDYNYRGSLSLVRTLTGVFPLKSVIRSGNSIYFFYDFVNIRK